MTDLSKDHISQPFTDAPDDHTILVIGSGYGGGVAASRLARAGQPVTVLERGREMRPGDYPKDMVTGLSEFQTTLSGTGKTYGKPYGLYDIRVSDNVNVFVGCGLGGTSLINANVAIEADPRSLKSWPEPYCSDPDALRPYYQYARDMLGSQPYPAGRSLPKLDALERVADGMKAPFKRADINVMFTEGSNPAGVRQNACTDCGDCVSGCNYGAKNTVLMNYLPDAVVDKAQIYVGADVQSLSRADDLWQVSVKDTATGKIRTLTAKMVILAAGTLGSTEILLRSRSDALQFSQTLGHQFSTNGDVWAFAYNANMTDPEGDDDDDKTPETQQDRRKPTYCVGAGETDVTKGIVHPSRKPGPCITGVITLGDQNTPLNECMIIEEGAMPGALAPIYAGLYPMIDAIQGDQFRFGDVGTRMGDVAKLADVMQNDPLNFADTAYDGPVSRTLPFLVMNHDAAEGALKLSHDRVYVDWDNAGDDPAFANSAKMLKLASDQIQAEFLPMPLWEDAFNKRVLAVHPLGGCPMGTDVTDGVVNADCQVFDPQGDLHEGLYVCDGSVLPSAVGVNPHLTITAIAERAMVKIAEAHTWEFGYAPRAPAPKLEPIDRPAPDLIDALTNAVKQLRKLRRAINAGYDVGDKLKATWDNLRAYYAMLPDDITGIFELPTTAQFMAYTGDVAGQKELLLPIAQQCLALLEPLLAALKQDDFKTALDLFETWMGDFSPPLWFPEKMEGRVSAVGIHDHKPQHSPYAVAADGDQNFAFIADISADNVRWVLDPDGRHATISGTAIWDHQTQSSISARREYMVDGTFKYLVLNDDAVECWNMVYEGTMTPKDGSQKKLRYRGFKTLQYREGSHWWRDLTELSFDIFDGVDSDDVLARGILKLGLEDVIKQANRLELAYQKPDLLIALSAAYGDLSTAIRHGKRADVPKTTALLDWRANVMKGALLVADIADKKLDPITKVQTLYTAKTLGKMGFLVLRAYGQFLSYMANFQAAAEPKAETHFILPPPQYYAPEIPPKIEGDPVIKLRLTRYQGGKKGPVMLAAGFGALASTFATPTVDRNLVQMLVADGFDVWLLDYRGSGDLPASLGTFDMDDVATEDWPAAIDMVLANTDDDVTDVQVIVHCVGSLVFFMAMLAGETRVRSVISSQLGPHTIINWFKYAQADSDISTYVTDGVPKKMWPFVDLLNLGDEVTETIKHGMPVVNPRAPAAEPSPAPGGDAMTLDQMIDGLVWKVPSFSPVPCNSPTCHRINFFFGPTYQHEQLNQATHDAIKDMFGPLSSKPYPHIARCFEVGHAVSHSADIDYMAGYGNLKFPIHFIVGAKNPLMLPECSLRTVDWLKTMNRDCADLYTRKVYQGYGHIDCFIGKTASVDIFPDLLKRLNETAEPGG